jgi:hypothetical protein
MDEVCVNLPKFCSDVNIVGASKIAVHEMVLCQLGEKTLTLTSVIHVNSYFSHITTNAQVFCSNVSL